MNLKQKLIYMWVSAMAVNATLWFSVDWIFDRNRNSRALLLESEGVVKSRPTSLTLWRPVHTGRELYDDEIIATENDSSALLVFQGGRSIELGPNTQLSLAYTSKGSSDAMVITLLKGQATVSNRTKNVSPDLDLELKSGNTAVKLGAADKAIVTLSKDVKKDDAQVIVAAGAAKLLNTVTGELQRITKKSTQPKQKPDLVKGAEAKKQEENKGLRYRVATLPKAKITWPQNNMSLWTIRPLSDRRGHLPVRAQVQGALTPGVSEAIIGVGESRYPVIAGKAAIPMTFLRQATSTTLGYRVQLMAGARFSNPNYRTRAGTKEDLGPETVSVDIRSLLALPARVQVVVPAVRSEPVMNSGWFLQTGVVNSGLQISLFQHSDVVRMASVFNAVKRFNIRSNPPTPAGQGIYLSRGGNIIASVKNATNLSDLRTLKTVLNADVVFSGNANALVPMNFNEAVLEELRKREEIYVASQGQLSTVRTELLLEDPAARNFVLGSAQGVFFQPVQVMGGN